MHTAPLQPTLRPATADDALCLGVLALIRRLAPHALRPAVLMACYAIGITASFWFLQRLLP